MISIENIFHRTDFDPDWSQEITDITHATKTLTLSRDGHAAVAIMALDARHVAYLERFVRVLTQRGLDVT